MYLLLNIAPCDGVCVHLVHNYGHGPGRLAGERQSIGLGQGSHALLQEQQVPRKQDPTAVRQSHPEQCSKLHHEHQNCQADSQEDTQAPNFELTQWEDLKLTWVCTGGTGLIQLGVRGWVLCVHLTLAHAAVSTRPHFSF